MSKATLLLVLFLVSLLLMGSISPALAQEEADDGEDGGSPVRLIIIIAVIWLAIMALVISVVVLTRRKTGEEDRDSREG